MSYDLITFALCRFLFIVVPILIGPAANAAASGTPVGADVRQGLASLPIEVQSAISASLGEDQPTYHAKLDGSTIHLDNPEHRVEARFDRQGVALQSAGANFRLQLQGVGSWVG